MANSIKRLTIYALISALEIDLREFLNMHVVPLVGPERLLNNAVCKKAKDRFEKDNPTDTPSICDLLNYLDLEDEISAVKRHDSKLDTTTKNYIRKYYLGFDGLIPIRNRVMHSRPLEYDDLSRASDLAKELTRSHGSLWANLRTTQRALQKDPEFAGTLTIPDTSDDSTSILHNLPQPEFDDTGFVGRERELNDLKRALIGPYPVITVQGEGGLGKSALALKACYDLLDDHRVGLDAIVWTTAKTTRLTLHEIEVIDGAISSSLGIIDNAANVLGTQPGLSSMEMLLMHLANNKILLVIDNLETVLDHNIKELVSKIPTGSRILFTTRIGLGAFDFPIPILPLSVKDAVFYFSITAKAWSVGSLATEDQSVVEQYCMDLKYNTLYIKWFLQSVRVGKRPAMLLSKPAIFLSFCLQNVFNTLSANARALATILTCVNGSQTVASLAFYSGFDSLVIQSSLSTLLTANLILSERGRSAEYEDRYSLSPLAQMYIQHYIRPSGDEQRRLVAKQHELRTAQASFLAKEGADIFDPNHVCVRDRDDYIPAKFLMQAIEHIFKKRFENGEEELRKAYDLAPNYFEVHRVRAFLYSERNEMFSAKSEYEAAISLAPERAPLRLWYGGLLSRYFGDQEGALEQLIKAEEFAPNAPQVKLECSRILQYLARFDESGARLRSLEEIEKQSSKIRRVHIDLSLQNEVRKAEHLISIGNCLDALGCLESAKIIYEAAPLALIDDRALRNFNRARRLFPALRRALVGQHDFKKLAEFENWLPFHLPLASLDEARVSPRLTEAGEECFENGKPSESPPNRGRLQQLHSSYGFIDAGGSRFFFHRSQWSGDVDFRALGEGSIVQFDITTSLEGKTAACNVRPIEYGLKERLFDKRFLGTVKVLGKNYGFINLDTGGDLFFSRDNCALTTRFQGLFVGERVRCKIGIDQNGKSHAENVESYSGTAT